MMVLSIMAADGVQQFYQLSGEAAAPTITMGYTMGQVSRTGGASAVAGYSSRATASATYSATPVKRLTKTAGNAVGGGSLGGGMAMGGSVTSGRGSMTGGAGITSAGNFTMARTTFDSPSNARAEGLTVGGLWDDEDEDKEQLHNGEIAPLGSSLIPLLIFLAFYSLFLYIRKYRLQKSINSKTAE